MSNTATQRTVSEYEVIDHGIEHAQYFQGCGCSYTRFDNVVTGCGESAAEAWDDALEQIAMDGVDVTSFEATDENRTYTSRKATEASVANYLEKNHVKLDEDADCELYYYVSIRFNTVTVEGGAQ